MYSVLDVRKIMAAMPDGSFVEQELVRIKDPWANSKEWNGFCSDHDTAFWNDDNKSKFNSRDVHDINEETNSDSMPSRFVHDFGNTGDGVFVMHIKDFMRYFNNLTICRNTSAEWLELKYVHSIEKSQGPFSTKTQQWLENA